MSVAATAPAQSTASKVPPILLSFWIAKILATTVGETGGDALSMTLKLGYGLSTLVFLALFVVALGAQLVSQRYRPVTYWAVVVATTTVGTTLSDYMDRTLGLGYVKSSAALLGAVIAVLIVWRVSTGHLAVASITSRRDETFYWLTILISNTLGTALGDFVASDVGLGFEKGALVFAGSIALVAAAHRLTKAPLAVLFWAAYVLTRPLGATLGDSLTKSHEEGGLGFSSITSSLVIALAMMAVVALTSLRRASSGPVSEAEAAVAADP